MSASAPATEEEDDVDAGPAPPEAEEDAEVRELLLGGAFPPPRCADKFSLTVSWSALRGWVRQPSPCCAAASVAGAFNALHHLGRDVEGAATAEDVMEIYRNGFRARLDDKRGAAAALIRVTDAGAFGALEAEVEARMEELGRPLALRKKDVDAGGPVTPSELRRAIRHVVQARSSSEADERAPCASAEEEMWLRVCAEYAAVDEADLIEAIQAKKDAAKKKGGSRAGSRVGSRAGSRPPSADMEVLSIDAAEDADADADVDADEDEDADAAASTFVAATRLVRIESSLLGLMTCRVGLAKLTSARPSTAALGNNDVMRAARELGDIRGNSPIVASLYAGRGCRGARALCISSKDSDETIEAQWRELMAEFASDEVPRESCRLPRPARELGRRG